MDKVFWVDLEMTGLDPATSVIIEFAGIVTDLNLNKIDTYHAVVYQPAEELAKMDAWNVDTHTKSGLLTEIPAGKPLARVDREVVEFLRPHFPESKPVLAGNSIHQDRKYIDRYMENLAGMLHYRMIDVSSFKQIFKHLYHITFPKQNSHKALEDIEASIAELAYYLAFIKVPG